MLARAERELGLESWCVSLQGDPFFYEVDEVLCSPGEPDWSREIKRWQLLARAIRDFDIIHFNFGSSIMPGLWRPTRLDSTPIRRAKDMVGSSYASALGLRDVPVLKRLGKKIVVTYQGDDARQGDYCRAHFHPSPTDGVEPGYYTSRTDALKRRRIRTFGKYADQIYSLNPDLMNVLPSSSEFLPYSHIDLREWQPVPSPRGESDPLLVVHAPTHRGVKGTPHVIGAVHRLQAEGIPIEFVLVENVSNRQARRIYETADLLVDQLLCGWYGGLAVELMALAKPVICYIRPSDLRFVPAGMRDSMPVINAMPETIYDTLKHWAGVGKGPLRERGKQSRAYVERWHDPRLVTTRLKSKYEEITCGTRTTPTSMSTV